MNELGRVAETIAGCRFAYGDEDGLQRGIAAALTEAGFLVEREVRLGRRCRIDLMVGRVGVEVKVKGTVEALNRQVQRYADTGLVDGIVVVSNRARHFRGPWTPPALPVRFVDLTFAAL